MRNSLLTILTIILLYGCRSPEGFALPDHARIVIIGNTFAERLQNYNFFEPLLYANFPSKKFTVRNLGWSGDEVNKQSRPFRYPSAIDLLKEENPDVIFVCFGMNESFDGQDSVDVFKKQFVSLVEAYRATATKPVQIVAVSPIAHEQLSYPMPDPLDHNRSLRAYSAALHDAAKENGYFFVDLFSYFENAMAANKASMTINGIHLNETGYRKAAELMAEQLGLSRNRWSDDLLPLKKIIDHKNQQYFYKYRAVNSEYIVGRRKEPWVQPPGGPISFPSELGTLDLMVKQMDSILMNAANESTTVLLDKVANLEGTCTFPHTDSMKANIETNSFLLRQGFAANLFASEKNFPLHNPVKMTFDPQGRLWVATMASYPQYYPGCPPNDKILILEDTNHDGSADKYTVFADSLYLPLSFEIGYGGVFVSQPPNLVFLRDTNNDNHADTREIILHGFGTEDVHHSISAFTWGQDGALYMHSGTFLHSQVETPYGLIRSDYGETLRYEPRTMKLEVYISYPYANPWGNVFMRDGTHLIGDVSTGNNYFAPPMTTATRYPIKHTEMEDLSSDNYKPKTCGMEIISSGNFPESLQQSLLMNTFIGFQGIINHKLVTRGSGLKAVRMKPVLQSQDPNFRPVDLQFGPDGTLYVVDWYNPIINHGERALRDPQRDHTHGRIWRIRNKNKETLPSVDMSLLSISEVLDQLKTYEDRTRYRSRMQLTNFPVDQLADTLAVWVQRLDKRDPQYDLYSLEALWVYQQLHRPNLPLLENLLSSKNEHVRAAAIRVLFDWRGQIADCQQRLTRFTKDQSAKVRLYTAVALSHFENDDAVGALLTIAQQPTDNYIEYALTQAFRNLSPVWKNRFEKDSNYLADAPAKADVLIASSKPGKEMQMPVFLEPDPLKKMYEPVSVTNSDLQRWGNHPVVMRWAQKLIADSAIGRQNKPFADNVIQLSTIPGKMRFNKTEINVTAGKEIVLHFTNNDNMVHNVVLTLPASDTIVGEAADKMAREPDGYERNFVPRLKQVILATPLVASGASYDIAFTAPANEGDYPFICTFPGHWRVMRGVMRVRNAK